MVQKKPPSPGSSGKLTHSPFAGLANDPKLATLAGSKPAATPKAPPPLRPVTLSQLRLRLEARGHSGKVVTRIAGLPRENLDAIASRLQKGLGCGGTIEEGDLVLQGSLVERASAWLDHAGNLRSIRDEPRQRKLEPVVESSAQPREPGSSATGTVRANVRRGQRVAIVQKADQHEGRLTTGVVQDVLTSSPTHPRGIKVRLESGEVGRVKGIY